MLPLVVPGHGDRDAAGGGVVVKRSNALTRANVSAAKWDRAVHIVEQLTALEKSDPAHHRTVMRLIVKLEKAAAAR